MGSDLHFKLLPLVPAGQWAGGGREEAGRVVRGEWVVPWAVSWQRAQREVDLEFILEVESTGVAMEPRGWREAGGSKGASQFSGLSNGADDGAIS